MHVFYKLHLSDLGSRSVVHDTDASWSLRPWVTFAIVVSYLHVGLAATWSSHSRSRSKHLTSRVTRRPGRNQTIGDLMKPDEETFAWRFYKRNNTHMRHKRRYIFIWFGMIILSLVAISYFNKLFHISFRNRLLESLNSLWVLQSFSSRVHLCLEAQYSCETRRI